MFKRFYLLAAASIFICASAFSQTSQEVATDVHVGFDYATKVLASERKDCKFVRRTIEQADGSSFVDCSSVNGKDDIRYRITPRKTEAATVDLVSRKPMSKIDLETPQARDAAANRHATHIIRDYRYECLHVIKVTVQEDSSLLAVCKPEYGRKPISYRLVETPSAHLQTRVIPIQ